MCEDGEVDRIQGGCDAFLFCFPDKNFKIAFFSYFGFTTLMVHIVKEGDRDVVSVAKGKNKSVMWQAETSTYRLNDYSADILHDNGRACNDISCL